MSKIILPRFGIAQGVRDCVVFLALKRTDGTYAMIGTGTLLVHKINSEKQTCYLLTAKHVIEGAISRAVDQVFIRGNIKDGGSEWYHTDLKDWQFDPDDTVDVAIINILYVEKWDDKFIPTETMTLLHKQLTNLTDYIGLNVVIPGLFVHHYGQNRNIPIVRMGSVVGIPEERILLHGKLREVYLIECRSIGGLSGSPVFFEMAKLPLAGIIYGHFDTLTSNIDYLDMFDLSQPGMTRSSINMGIAIVTPIDSAIELINEDSKARYPNDYKPLSIDPSTNL